VLPQKSGNVLEAALYRGELPRGDAAGLVATGERQARRIVVALIDKGVSVRSKTGAAARCCSSGPFTIQRADGGLHLRSP